jgi:hypothetical protein
MIKETLLYLPSLVPTGNIGWLFTFIASIGAIFLPISAVIHVVIVLVFIDNITGIGADCREKGIPIRLFNMKMWGNIKSSKLGRSLTKTLAYILLIIGSFLIDQYMLGFEAHYLVKVIGGAIAFRELISILENTEKISGKSFITSIIGFIRNGFKKTFADELEKEHKKKGK